MIKAVVGRLTGADNQLGSILRLDTSYGGGKTHALIGLNHILTAPEQIPNLAEGEPLVPAQASLGSVKAH